MNLDLTEEQQMLKKSARDFFEKEFPKTLGLYYRRSRQAALLFGDTDSCREKVAQEVGL